MSKTKFAEYNEIDRKRMLEEGADSIEEKTYWKPLSDSDKDELKDVVVNDSSKADELKEALAEHNKKEKEKIKELDKSRRLATSELRSGTRRFDGLVYQFFNFEDRLVEEYDAQGELISSRKMKASEKQATIHSLNRAAND